MVAGKVPYRDLFEQKGPIVYAVFAVACCFPNEQFVVWLFEILCISLYLYFCYRIARKFLSPWLSLAVVPLMMMVLSTNYARGLDGACVEEYCLPIFAYGLLCFLDFIMDQRAATWRRSLAIGICLGVLFWVKFSLWEFFLLPMLIWLIINLVHRKFTAVVRSGFIMLGGVLLVTIPIVIAYAAVGALDDLFQVYFKINLFNYTGESETGAVMSGDYIHLDLNPVEQFLMSFFFSGIYYALTMIFGLIYFAVKYWRQKSGWLLLIAVLPTGILIGCFCGHWYYYIPMFAYAVLGIIFAIQLVSRLFQAVELKIQRRWISGLILVLVAVVSCLMALPAVRNTSEINRPREDYAPLVVADMLTEYNQTAEQPATLFCYRMYDWGFYNAASIVPTMRFYAENVFTKDAFPEMFDAFDTTIRQQTCDFVIVYYDVYLANETFLATYYRPYLGTTPEESRLPFRHYDATGYDERAIIILFRKSEVD